MIVRLSLWEMIITAHGVQLAPAQCQHPCSQVLTLEYIHLILHYLH